MGLLVRQDRVIQAAAAPDLHHQRQQQHEHGPRCQQGSRAAHHHSSSLPLRSVTSTNTLLHFNGDHVYTPEVNSKK